MLESRQILKVTKRFPLSQASPSQLQQNSFSDHLKRMDPSVTLTANWSNAQMSFGSQFPISIAETNQSKSIGNQEEEYPSKEHHK